jgi:tetratricopeptide (TPR) repeat protein
MFDITIFVENWWIVIPAFVGILAMLIIYVFYRKQKAVSTQGERDYREKLTRDIQALREQMKHIERESRENIILQIKSMNEQIKVLESEWKEKSSQPKPPESEDTKKSEKLQDTFYLLFPQLKLLEKLEQFKQISLTAEEVRNIVSDILEKTQIFPEKIDLQTGDDRWKKFGFFEKSICTLLSHRIYDIEKEFNMPVGDESVYVILGNLQYENGDFLRAKDYYQKALEVKPSSACAWNNLGLSLIRISKHGEALGAFEKTLELEPQDARAWHTKGIILGRLDLYEEALTAFDKALELNPHYARAWHSSGVVLGHLSRYEEALKAYENAIELEPDSPDTWHNKGVTLIQLGLHEKALKAYDRAIKLKPTPDAWYNKGIALGRLGRYEDALKAFEIALDLKPDFSEAWYNKACLYSLKGDKTNALADLSKAIMINPACRNMAKEDEEFRNLFEDEDFKKIVGQLNSSY